MSIRITNFYEHKPRTAKPRQLVIVLHGLGADGRDLIDLASLWAKDLPEAVFVAPDAPFPCDMAPVGYQWFSLQSRAPADILRGIEKAAPALSDFMTEQSAKYGIPADKMALAGFSQGAMMSLYAGPRYPKKIAGILAYSGALFGGEGLIQDPEEFHKVPVHLIHGEADEVVPVQGYKLARRALEQAGFSVTGHSTPGLPHSIDEKGIESGGAFLKSVLLS
jgi:phospholipase/carboxylesterase